MNTFNKDRTGTGTREWAEISYNIGRGCSNDCVYCYARKNALTYKSINSPSEWANEIVDIEKAGKSYPNRGSKTIMFPTTHDITPAYLDAAIMAIGNILRAGNRSLLIVSKPKLECIAKICESFPEYRDCILFRFSIGTTEEETARLWEPGAPPPSERIAALKLAKEAGYRTSVSMEPFYGSVTGALETFRAVTPFVTDDIWIGKMNHIASRVMTHTPELDKAIKVLEEGYGDDKILELVKLLAEEPKVKWKDSIKQVLECEK